jgi:anti-sigma factor RsiW
MTKKKQIARAALSSETRLTCQQVTDLIVDYVTGELDPTTRSVLETHLHNCRDCVAFLNTYRETIRVTRAVRYEDVPTNMLDRVQQALRAKFKEA